MVRAKVVTVMRLCMQDEVNQEESEQYEVDGWYYRYSNAYLKQGLVICNEEDRW